MSIKIPKISTSDTSGSLASKIIEIHPLVFSCWSRLNVQNSNRWRKHKDDKRRSNRNVRDWNVQPGAILKEESLLQCLPRIYPFRFWVIYWIIGLLYCQFSAVGGASTVKHHWKQLPPEIRMSKWKIGHSNPEFEGWICVSCILQDCKFHENLHLVPDVVALLWPLLPLGKIKPLWSSCNCVWSCVKWKPGTMWWLKGLSSPWREGV